VAGKRIALFGFAFKADTGDTRESPAIHVARELVEERAEVVITDPKALENAERVLGDLGGRVLFEPDPYEAAAGAHAIAVMTEWKQYRELDYGRILRGMVQPAFLFDGRNVLDHQALFELGFNVYPIGRPPLSHLK
jgi:UDPglucose 6-dehydrogenase